MSEWSDDNSNDWLGAEEHARAGMDLADRGLQAGDTVLLNRAAARLRAAIDVHPDNADWHAALARVLEALGDLKPAADAYQAALDLDASDHTLFERLASVLCRTRRYEKAIDILDQLLSLEPSYEPAYCLKVEAYTELGNHEAADETYYLGRLYSEHCPRCDHAIARSLIAREKYRQAAAVLERLLTDARGNERSDILSLLAIALEGTGHLDAARSAYSESISRLPRDITLLIGYGRLLERMGDTHLAGETFRQAAEYAPESPAAHYWLARWTLSHTDSYAKVEHHARQALVLDPTLEGAQTLLARCRLIAGDLPSANNHLLRELELRSSDPIILFELAQGFQSVGNDELAGETLQRLVQISPDSISAWQNLAAWHLNRNELSAGLEASYRALRLSPANPEVLYNLALGFFRSGHLDEADAWLRQLRRAHPTDRTHAPLTWRIRLARIKAKLRIG